MTFLDAANNLWKIAPMQMGQETWLYYWHHCQYWVPLRRCEDTQGMYLERLSDGLAALYDLIHERHTA